MSKLNRLALIPCLAPLILVLIISAMNINKPVRLKLLTWTTPPMSIGLLMALGGCTGALLMATIGLALTNDEIKLERQVYINANINKNSNQFIPSDDLNNVKDLEYEEISAEPLPQRDLRDPSPTISVPFKVLNRKADHQTEVDIDNQELDKPLYENIDYDQNYEESYFVDKQSYQSDEEILDDSKGDLIDSNEDWDATLGEEW